MPKKFNYTYFAPTEAERTEIEEIRAKYTGENEHDEDMKKLKKLDAKVQNIPTAISLCVGVLGTLLFGLGLTMVLEWSQFLWGIIVALAGCAPIAFAHPLHTHLSKKLKEKHSPEILKISEKLLNEKTDK